MSKPRKKKLKSFRVHVTREILQSILVDVKAESEPAALAIAEELAPKQNFKGTELATSYNADYAEEVK